MTESPMPPLSVLLVEDNPADARFVREMLREESATPVAVTHASRLREALAYLQSQEFSAVLLDLTLPDSEGLETFARARAEAPNAPIVVLTGLADEALAARAVRQGAQDYLVKGRVSGQVLYQSIRFAVERYAATDRLQQSEERFRQLADNVKEAFVIGEVPSFRAVYVSNAWAEIWGRPVQHAYASATAWADAVHAEDRAALEAGQATLASGSPATFVFRVLRPDATQRWVRARTFPVLGSRGVYRFVGLIEDITEIRRTEEELQQARKMEAVGRLAGGIAHDFNNLLSAILGLAELVLHDLGPDHPSTPDVQRIEQAGRSAAGLTQQLLAFSRRQILQPQVLDVNEVVRHLEPLLRRLIGAQVSLALRLEDGLQPISADPSQMEQVIINLCVNAHDAMPDGGRLVLQTATVDLDEGAVAHHPGVAPGAYVLLSVTDTGSGMDEATRERLFEPFFTTKEIGRGTGLGLATVYGIVRQSRGFIYVYSEPGLGTTFKVYFPVVDGEPARSASRTPDPAPAGGTETVLLAEDQPELRSVAAEILRRHGYRVLEASDGDEALRLAAGTGDPIHLLLTDVVMPGLGGREVAMRARTLRPDLKVIYMSGYADDTMLRRGVVDAELDFVQKPFSASSLLRKLREVLDAPR